MERTILILFVCAIIGAGIMAGLAGFATGANSGWSPSDYQVKDGECWVRPQGDPLYDSFYAKEVNLPNCKAYETQEQAQYVEANADKTEWQTTQSRIATWGFSGVVLFIIVFILAMAFRR